jgi:hypothetical protein
VDSSDSSLSQRSGPLDLNEALFHRGLGPRGLCHKEMTRAGGIPCTSEALLSFVVIVLVGGDGSCETSLSFGSD